MAIVECASCGGRAFLLRGGATATRCPRCEETLIREEAGAEVERRVRERLYGAGGRRDGSGSPRKRHRAEERRPEGEPVLPLRVEPTG